MITKICIFLRSRLYHLIFKLERFAAKYCKHNYEPRYEGSTFKMCNICLHQIREIKNEE